MSYIVGFIKGTWTVIKVLQTLLLTLLLVIFFWAIFSAMMAGKKAPSIPSGGAALVISFDKPVVERPEQPTPQSVFRESFERQLALRDVLKGISKAAEDDRIKVIVLDLDGYKGMFPAALDDIGQTLKAARAKGKKVIAMADGYGQGAYLLAVHADEIYMHPYGNVTATGYGAYRMYFKDLLDKLAINVHVFKVGTYKSAIEPFTRNDMSEADKIALKAILDDLWGGFVETVNSERSLAGGGLAELIANAVAGFRSTGGDMAVHALNSKLVDGLKTRDEQRDYLIEMVGKDKDEKTFRQISLSDYLTVLEGPAYAKRGQNKAKVAVVVAEGPIVMGDAKYNWAAADTVSEFLRKAAADDDVKAVVLRVNSPGGSVIASEIIRREAQKIRDAGKPLVASMGGVAASGGYWISMAADEVWAAPSTLTGSIGVFALVPTFENTVKLVGVNVDGIGTTKFSGSGAFGRPLADETGEVLQLVVQDGYNKFLRLVADSRGKSVEEIDSVAQGRVWTGAQAKERGLVDNLGYLNDAIAAAAKRANLKDYTVDYVDREPSQFEALLTELMGEGTASLGLDGLMRQPSLAEEVMRAAREAERDLMLNDPNALYAICSVCVVR